MEIGYLKYEKEFTKEDLFDAFWNYLVESKADIKKYIKTTRFTDLQKGVERVFLISGQFSGKFYYRKGTIPVDFAEELDDETLVAAVKRAKSGDDKFELVDFGNDQKKFLMEKAEAKELKITGLGNMDEEELKEGFQQELLRKLKEKFFGYYSSDMKAANKYDGDLTLGAVLAFDVPVYSVSYNGVKTMLIYPRYIPGEISLKMPKDIKEKKAQKLLEKSREIFMKEISAFTAQEVKPE